MSKSNLLIEYEAEKLIAWYKKSKSTFSSGTYVGKGTFLKPAFILDSKWNTKVALKKEMAFNLKGIAILNERFKDRDPQVVKKFISLLLVCLKNRIEYAANRSDFYPVYATLLIFIYSVFSLFLPLHWNVVPALITLGLVTITVKSRLDIRLKLAHTKKLINILEMYDADFLSPRLKPV